MSTVEEIVNAAKSLPPEQQAELKRRLDALAGAEANGGVLPEGESSQRREELHARIHRALYDAGLVKEANPILIPFARRNQRANGVSGSAVSDKVVVSNARLVVYRPRRNFDFVSVTHKQWCLWHRS